MPLPPSIYKCIESNKKEIKAGEEAIANMESTRKKMAQGENQKDKVAQSCLKALSDTTSIEKAEVKENKDLAKSWAKLQNAFERPASATQTNGVQRGSDHGTAPQTDRVQRGSDHGTAPQTHHVERGNNQRTAPQTQRVERGNDHAAAVPANTSSAKQRGAPSSSKAPKPQNTAPGREVERGMAAMNLGR
jgi:hypothetical protein